MPDENLCNYSSFLVQMSKKLYKRLETLIFDIRYLLELLQSITCRSISNQLYNIVPIFKYIWHLYRKLSYQTFFQVPRLL